MNRRPAVASSSTAIGSCLQGLSVGVCTGYELPDPKSAELWFLEQRLVLLQLTVSRVNGFSELFSSVTAPGCSRHKGINTPKAANLSLTLEKRLRSKHHRQGIQASPQNWAGRASGFILNFLLVLMIFQLVCVCVAAWNRHSEWCEPLPVVALDLCVYFTIVIFCKTKTHEWMRSLHSIYLYNIRYYTASFPGLLYFFLLVFIFNHFIHSNHLPVWWSKKLYLAERELNPSYGG